MSDTQKLYVERLKLAAIYAAAVLVFAIANNLAARYLGPDAPKLEAPAPVIVVAPGGDGPAPVVQVLHPKGQ